MFRSRPLRLLVPAAAAAAISVFPSAGLSLNIAADRARNAEIITHGACEVFQAGLSAYGKHPFAGRPDCCRSSVFKEIRDPAVCAFRLPAVFERSTPAQTGTGRLQGVPW